MWRLILRDGISAVSVRDVAAEAGLSTGSLRHMFASKADLLAFSMDLVFVRLRARVRAHLSIKDPRDRALAMVSELLPLDEERRRQLVVSLALTTEAPSHPQLDVIALNAQRETRRGFVALLRYLARHDRFAPDLDIDVEAARLHAFVDGAAVHAMLGEPDTPEAALRMITAHLDSLAG